MNTVTAISSSADEFDRTISSLVAAFVADPFIRWLFPDAKQYLTYFPQVLKYFAGAAFEHDSAYRSDDFKAAALWLPPYVEPDEESLGRVMEEGVDSKLHEQAFAVLEQVGTSHPDVPHWYLPAIGVEPMMQRKGYGSVLMDKGISVCDEQNIAAYLESTNPENIPLYQRFGFEVVGEIQIGSSPIITRMLRAA